MANVYRVKDGPRDDRTDEGTEMSISYLTSVFSGYQCRYLNDQLPAFNTKTPSDFYRHIVVEVTEDSELNNKFDKKGFYIVDGLDPSQASFLYQERHDVAIGLEDE